MAAAVFDHNRVPIAAVGVTVGHRCPAGSPGGAPAEAPTDGGGNKNSGQHSGQHSGPPGGRDCGQNFAELAGPVRAAAREITTAIGGQVAD